MNIRILRFPEVCARIGGYTRMHINRLEKDGKFPKRIKLGGNSVGWIESEIDGWLKEKAAQRGTPIEVERKRGFPADTKHPAP